MTQEIKAALEFAEQQNVEMIDLKFCDLFGRWHHLTIPMSQFDETVFTRGRTESGPQNSSAGRLSCHSTAGQFV